MLKRMGNRDLATRPIDHELRIPELGQERREFVLA